MAEKAKKTASIKDFTSKAGNTYKLQKVSPAQWLDVLDDVEDGGKKGQRKRMYSSALEHIVVSPQMTVEDFEDFGEMDEVVAEAIRFQQGK